MNKVVLDTNVLVSALIKKEGTPARILRHLDDFVLVTADDLLAELEDVLHRRHIQQKYHLTDADIQEYLARLRAASTLVQLHSQVDVVIDPDDNMFVACAADGGAAYIVSGDPHLLDLHAYEGIQILTPIAFLSLLEGTGSA
ncbi:MAG: putative toxin-antitoxin system toxin component, PIN family [Herpetosiphon sp.]